jgi:3-oxoadipate enol-lactonase
MPWCDCAGVTIHYELSGRPGRVLILIHELGGSLESWDEVVPMIDGAFHVLRYDQRGAGLSEKVRAPFTMENHATDLERLVDGLGLVPPYDVAGVAAGAVAAVAFAARARTRVRALVLCSPSIGIQPDRRRYFFERSEIVAREGMRAVAESTLAKSYPHVAIRDRKAYEDYRARFLANDPVCYGLANRALADSDVEPALASLDCPCLLLAGTHDALRPPDNVRALAARIRGAEFAVLDSGHFINLQAPHALAERMLAFFDDRAGRADLKVGPTYPGA